ncbi:FitA-like ribbon-helix-helix domain-containing protein [Tautonia plasticadhaerens]|uniref:Antitoxin FitA-like ribbon-helix-helix domain-containing protein n=1 Tax=Tautonia plasticadhaerens TaxID=2527974 RepID=A0A518HET9_9BACT|nr:Arc family DNA-binding protein [Tautonia plasticadhaerens]QDV39367.1 hypothetical protein ElP_73330 [Tautonia plasticadhaerens]
MPDVLVRDLDDASLERLKGRARAHGRSLGAELRLILQQAARQADLATARARAEQMTRRLADRRHTDGVELLGEDRRR